MSKPEMPEDMGDACAPDRTIEGLQQGLRDVARSRDDWEALADRRWQELVVAAAHNHHLQNELAAANAGPKTAAEGSEELEELRAEIQKAHEWKAAVVAVVALGGSR
jgi:hypothetical protein